MTSPHLARSLSSCFPLCLPGPSALLSPAFCSPHSLCRRLSRIHGSLLPEFYFLCSWSWVCRLPGCLSGYVRLCLWMVCRGEGCSGDGILCVTQAPFMCETDSWLLTLWDRTLSALPIFLPPPQESLPSRHLCLYKEAPPQHSCPRPQPNRGQGLPELRFLISCLNHGPVTQPLSLSFLRRRCESATSSGQLHAIASLPLYSLRNFKDIGNLEC